MSFVYSIPCISKPRVRGSNPLGRANEDQAYQQRRQNAQRSINQGMRMLRGGCTLGVNC